MAIGKRHNNKNLKIWSLGIEIADEIFEITKTFPKYERYDLSSQMNRCSISKPSNIAEDSVRTDKSFSHFLDIFLGSSFELGTQLIPAFNRKYIDKITLTSIEKKIKEFQRMTIGFQNKL